ncbi:MAG TPA: hypothetical protein PLC89_15995 [Haliscomenobacter sp.]|uniref:hypothetical protein n=1 Tax=Haliscomenobacter sp. TaxID=2717303 RepID=UPI002C4D6067|nr:hypothetical protein [Haliscomenobacter sp.]HOY18805.1 hypothetical protein [Haliscomenobacter sp.]
MLPHPEIDLASIEAIVSNPNPVLRNLQITQTYSELNLALTKLLGKTNVSWCAYATWASKTAGKFIRLDNVDAAIAEFLRGKDWLHEMLEAVPGALTWFGWKVKINDSVLLKILNETAQASADEVAKGNLLVFAELAPLYAQFLQSVSGNAEQKEAELETFLTYLKSTQNDQDYEKLVQAYFTYQQSIFETEPKAKAELLLLANVLVGYHEQIRLDPAINNSLNAPIEQVFKKKLLGGLERWIEASMPRFLFYLIAPILKASLKPVINKMAAHWRTISTRQLMRIEVPDGHLDLSEDIPLIAYHPKRMFPLDLETIHNADLQKVLIALDRSPDSTKGTAARDWGNLGERMNFIADFFRSDQQDRKLFLSPFNQEQTWAIKNGQIPAGKL